MEGRRTSRREEDCQSVAECRGEHRRRRTGDQGKRQRKRQEDQQGIHKEDYKSVAHKADNKGVEICDSSFRVLYCNADSLLNKIDELTLFVVEDNPDFIVINETWANESLNNAFFNIPGFEVVTRKDRVDTTRGIGGGLLIYAKSSLAGSVAEYTKRLRSPATGCTRIPWCSPMRQLIIIKSCVTFSLPFLNLTLSLVT